LYFKYKVGPVIAASYPLHTVNRWV